MFTHMFQALSPPCPATGKACLLQRRAASPRHSPDHTGPSPLPLSTTDRCDHCSSQPTQQPVGS